MGGMVRVLSGEFLHYLGFSRLKMVGGLKKPQKISLNISDQRTAGI